MFAIGYRAVHPRRYRQPMRRGAIPGILAALAVCAPAVAQEAPAGAPTSILPDMFERAPAPSEATPEAAAPIVPEDILSPPAGVRPPAAPGDPVAAAIRAAEAAALAAQEAEDRQERQFGPFRSAADAGLLTIATTGLAPDLFEGSDGRFLAALLNRLDGPLALRWGQILVQRALLTQGLPPPGIHPGDWLAARVRALVALGAASDAHRMTSRVALADYSPRLMGAAAEAALAAGDPMGICPFAAGGREASGDNAAFVLADAWCAAAGGDAASANLLLEEARNEGIAGPFDLQLAERVASMAGGTRGAGNPVWADITSLTAWRLGLAAALGLGVPDELLARASPVERGWMVRMPGLGADAQAALAPEAAAIGLISGAEFRRILARAAEATPVGELETTPGGLLRTALAGPDASARLEAIARLSALARPGSLAAYGWQVATAEAAARIAPDPSRADVAPALLEAMLAGGFTGNALAWWPVLAEAEPAIRERAALLLAPLADEVPVTDGALDRLARAGSPHRAALARAGLLGLGRAVPGAPPAVLDNGWTRALDAAVAGRRRGEVLVLAATGLQGPIAELAPDHFRRIVGALKASGFGSQAALLVCEAITRG
jgi:hypothetical protein